MSKSQPESESTETDSPDAIDSTGSAAAADPAATDDAAGTSTASDDVSDDVSETADAETPAAAAKKSIAKKSVTKKSAAKSPSSKTTSKAKDSETSTEKATAKKSTAKKSTAKKAGGSKDKAGASSATSKASSKVDKTSKTSKTGKDGKLEKSGKSGGTKTKDEESRVSRSTRNNPAYADPTWGSDPKELLRPRFFVMVGLVLLGIAYAWVASRWTGQDPGTPIGFGEALGDPGRKWVWFLDLWNWVLAFGISFAGLVVGAFPRGKPILSYRSVVCLSLIGAGALYIVLTWRTLGASPLEQWQLYDLLAEDQPVRRVWDLGLWNYAIGFGAILLGLILGAHPATPLGRGNGVVVGMLTCFAVGLLWICTFYMFADRITDIWILGALGQWNLVVGISFLAVGFSYAVKWE